MNEWVIFNNHFHINWVSHLNPMGELDQVKMGTRIRRVVTISISLSIDDGTHENFDWTDVGGHVCIINALAIGGSYICRM